MASTAAYSRTRPCILKGLHRPPLLGRGIPPILKDCRSGKVEEVRLQTERLEWHTNDLLIIGSRGASGRRQLAAHVKRQFTISSKNDDCRKAVADFWKDFKSNRFNAETDRLALVTLQDTDALLHTFGSLLECTRASLKTKRTSPID